MPEPLFKGDSVYYKIGRNWCEGVVDGVEKDSIFILTSTENLVKRRKELVRTAKQLAKWEGLKVEEEE